MTLRNDFLPFLYSNQYVNYPPTAPRRPRRRSCVRTPPATWTKVGRVFDFVVDHFTYDYDKASTVSSGYLPVVDDILAAKRASALTMPP